jgi:ethanolamine utilization microcompartment shell protein EutL
MENPINAQHSPTDGKKYSTSAAGGDQQAKRTAAQNATNKTVRHEPQGKPHGKLGGMAS